ncbi:MAG: SEL1-like repeat protein, partial [Elusimicrobiaceae bacterium]|nr:SEL1-like repeat protein [Elusimicrobiaceae bacterium]
MPMEMLEARTGIAILFVLALILFFLRKYTHNPVKKLLEKASKADTEAQYQLAILFYQGKKVPQDSVQAFNWFYTAAQADISVRKW